jgi:hypothetical protein
LKAIAGRFISTFSLDYSNHEVAGVTEQIICTLLFLAPNLLANNYDSTISEGFLLCEGMGVVIPTSLDELWENILSTCISFGYHNLFSYLTL